ncbi:MAG: SDR family oxidoreductase [Hyphomonadaceae bacterium]|nr:SDR family oxidoreductase [Hyphomonadaceae bacterium]
MTPPAGNRTVIVGGCGGIGHALAKACQALDHRVAVLDLPRSIESSPPVEGIEPMPLDITQAGQVESTLSRVDAELGGIDTLINLVGFMNKRARIEEIEDDEWASVMDGNLEAVARLLRRAVPIMNRATDASIVLISSGMGVRPLPFSAPYSIAKAGIIALTKALALECAPRIRTNAIAPGAVQTAFLTGGTGRDPGTPGDSPFDIEAYKKTIPMRRMAETADIVGPILFLASPAAGFINGQTLHVNGGGLMP